MTLSITTAPFEKLLAQSVFLLQFLVGLADQSNDNRHEDDHGDQAADKAGAKGTGGDQGTDLEDQEAHGMNMLLMAKHLRLI